MKRSASFPFLIFLSGVFFSCSDNKQKDQRLDLSPPYPDAEEQKIWEEQQKNGRSQSAEPFAVVELFSSEGCSDCPAAEEVLNRLTKDAIADKSYVYPLAFHVDYWNKLGWKDVFSDSSYSNRQRKYRRSLGNEVVYTPQMIVNGLTEFTGSDEKRAHIVIDSVLKLKPECYFTIHPSAVTSGDVTVNVEYEIIQFPARDKSMGFDICFAIVERGLQTHVGYGENVGKTLKHENVVRVFKSMELKEKTGTVELSSFGKSPGGNHSLIVFVQERGNRKIIGANLWNF